MFRTRDFILFLVVIVFLLFSMGAKLIKITQDSTASTAPVIEFSKTVESEFTAEIVEESSFSRSQKLADMRQKIADGSQLSISAQKIEIEEKESDVPLAEATTMVDRCTDYRLFVGEWSTSGLMTKEAEGVRLFYKEVLASEVSLVATNTDQSTNLVHDVLFQLPIFPIPSSAPFCLTSDVVGFAKDGSLIRNSEAALYSLFGNSTVIGYALDGYPIYGLSEGETDECGGSSIDGVYGYRISSDREEVLNCFRATPSKI